MDSLVIPKTPQWLFLSVQNYLMFNAYGEGYLCLLKMFLFLSIPSVYFIQFLREIYMEKVLQELFWVPFFGRPYRSNSTRIHLGVTLACKKSPLLFITLIVWDIAMKKMKEKSKVLNWIVTIFLQPFVDLSLAWMLCFQVWLLNKGKIVSLEWII